MSNYGWRIMIDEDDHGNLRIWDVMINWETGKKYHYFYEGSECVTVKDSEQLSWLIDRLTEIKKAGGLDGEIWADERRKCDD